MADMLSAQAEMNRYVFQWPDCSPRKRG